MELIKDKIYVCADNQIRKLDKIENDFIHYSVPIGKKDNKVDWMKLGKTNRRKIESDFINGKIINENEI